MLSATMRISVHDSLVCLDAGCSIPAACLPKITHLPVDGPGADGPLLPFRSGRRHQLCPRSGLRIGCLSPIPSPVSQQGARSGSTHRLLGTAMPDAVPAHAGWLPHSLPCRRHQGPQGGQADARREDAASAIGQQLQAGIHHGSFVSGHFLAGPGSLRTRGSSAADIAHS